MKKISEIEVEKYTKLVETERENLRSSIAQALTYKINVNQRAREDATTHDQMLRQTLAEFKQPILQASDQISIIYDSFNNKLYRAYRLHSLVLITYQEKSGEVYFAGCRRSSIEAIMRTSLKIYCLSPGDGYSKAKISLNGANRVCPLFSGSMASVRNLAII